VVLSPGPSVTVNAASLTEARLAGPGLADGAWPERAGAGAAPPAASVMTAAAPAVAAVAAVSPVSLRRRRARLLAQTCSTGVSMRSPEKDSRTWDMTSCSFIG
jgi:hypothetical protein